MAQGGTVGGKKLSMPYIFSYKKDIAMTDYLVNILYPS